MPKHSKAKSTERVFQLIARAADHYLETNKSKGYHYANHLRITVTDTADEVSNVACMTPSPQQPDSALTPVQNPPPSATQHSPLSAERSETYEQRHADALAILNARLDAIGFFDRDEPLQLSLVPNVTQAFGDDIPPLSGKKEVTTPTYQDEFVSESILLLRSKL